MVLASLGSFDIPKPFTEENFLPLPVARLDLVILLRQEAVQRLARRACPSNSQPEVTILVLLVMQMPLLVITPQEPLNLGK